jgi:hypothetical protein
MSSASTIGLPFLKSNFVAPAIASGVTYNYALSNNFNIPAGNYIAWIYLSIRGNADTILGPTITVINNGVDTYPFTSNSSTVNLNGDTIVFQNTQVVSISTDQLILLRGQIDFDNNAPAVAGVIYFYPI